VSFRFPHQTLKAFSFLQHRKKESNTSHTKMLHATELRNSSPHYARSQSTRNCYTVWSSTRHIFPFCIEYSLNSSPSVSSYATSSLPVLHSTVSFLCLSKEALHLYLYHLSLDILLFHDCCSSKAGLHFSESEYLDKVPTIPRLSPTLPPPPRPFLLKIHLIFPALSTLITYVHETV
jgi:hypothetical protein